MSRRDFVKLSAVGAAAAALDAAGVARIAQAQGIEKPKLTIAVGGKAAFYYLPLTIIEQRGFFKEEGLTVEIVDFAGGSRALQAVVGGSADICSGGYEHTITLQTRKQYFTSFVVQGIAMQVVLGYAAKKYPNYKGVQDLKGAKIGVSAPGSSTNVTANYVLAKAGLKPTDVSFVGVGTGSGAIAAVRSGQVDAISNVDPVMAILERAGDIKIVADTRTPKGTADVFGGPIPAACLYTSDEFIRKNPNTVQALTNAMVKALKWLQTAGPSELLKTVPEAYLLGDRGIYLDTYDKIRPAISRDGLMPVNGPETTLRMHEFNDPKVKEAGIDLSRTWTNEFTKKALARIKTVA